MRPGCQRVIAGAILQGLCGQAARGMTAVVETNWLVMVLSIPQAENDQD
jgi:hypothetical protein